MMKEPRFTISLVLRDNHSFDRPLQMSVSCDEALRISARAVDEMKAGFATLSSTVEMMKVREMRKDVFQRVAERLARMMAERMEDAEGWHDVSRVEPALPAFRSRAMARPAWPTSGARRCGARPPQLFRPTAMCAPTSVA